MYEKTKDLALVFRHHIEIYFQQSQIIHLFVSDEFEWPLHVDH